VDDRAGMERSASARARGRGRGIRKARDQRLRFVIRL
jgi:hypothetical protein